MHTSLLRLPKRPLGHRRHRGSAPARQQGLGLLEVVLLTLLLGGMVLGGLVSLRTLQQSQQAEAAEQNLRRADRAVITFVAQRNRLPCPDVDGDGREDALATGTGCSATAGQKGWLPLTTLGLDGTGTDQGAMPRLLYLVQRQAQDLGLADPVRHNPPAFDTATGQYSGVRPLNQIATTDICQGIENARSVALAGGQAQTDGRALAYALVHSGRGDFSGTGEGFEGLNRVATSVVAVEPPQRGWTPGVYDDRVWVQTYAGMATALECERLLASSRLMGFASEWVDEVNEQKESTRNSAIISSTINGISAGVAVLKTAMAAKGLLNAITHLAAAASALAGAIASCIILVGCALIPTFAAAVAAAIASIAAYTVTITLAATSLAASLVAMGLSISVAVQAGAEVNAGFNLDQVRGQAQTAYNEAVVRRQVAQGQYNDAVRARDTSSGPAYNAAVASFEGKVASFANYVTSLNDCGSASTDYDCSPPLSLATYQPQINTIKSAVDTLVQRELAYQDAEAAYQRAINGPQNPSTSAPSNSRLPSDVRDKLVAARDQAQAAGDTERVTGLNNAIAYLDNQQSGTSGYTDSQRAADIAAQINQVQAQIDAYDAQIAALNSQLGGVSCSPLPTAEPQRQRCVDRGILEQQRAQAAAMRATLQQQLNGLNLDVATAQGLRNSARSARDAAQLALDNAKASLNGSLSAMRYTTCVRGVNPGSNGQPDQPYSVCTVRYYNAIANDSNVFIEYSGDPPSGATCIPLINRCLVKDYTNRLNEIVRTRYDYAIADKAVQEAQATLTKAQQDETDAMATVQALSGVNAGGIPVWSGAADILQRADRKGGIQ